MLIALEDLHLGHLWVACPGDQAYELGNRTSAIPVAVSPALLPSSIE